jgi:hypothetical protein
MTRATAAGVTDKYAALPKLGKRGPTEMREKSMRVSVKAVRDSDGALLGETEFDITDRDARRRVLDELITVIYATAADPLRLPPFTFKFCVTKISN